jgi:hypothetical protein
MGTYQPLTESLHELNQIVMQSRQWDAQQKAAEAQWGLQKLELENKMKNDEQTRQIRQAQVEEAQAAITPKPLNASDFLQDSAITRKLLFEQNNGMLAKEMAAHVGPGVRLNADLSFTGPDNQPVALNKWQREKVAPGLFAIAIKYDDPEYHLQEQANQAQLQIEELDARIKEMPAQAIQFQPKIAALKQQRNQAQGMLQKYYNDMEPPAILKDLRRQYKNIETFELGMSGGMDPQTANAISASKAQVNNRIIKLEGEIQAAKLAEIKANKEKKNQGQQHFAVKEDANGNILDIQIANTDKEIGGAMRPEDVNPNLKGYVWKEKVDMSREALKGSGAGWKDEYNAVRANFWNETTGTYRDASDAILNIVANRRLADLRNGVDDGMKLQPVDRIQDATNYPKKVYAIYEQIMKDLAMDPTLTSQQKAEEMAAVKEDWIKDYGFTPEYYKTIVLPRLDKEAEQEDEFAEDYEPYKRKKK